MNSNNNHISLHTFARRRRLADYNAMRSSDDQRQDIYEMTRDEWRFAQSLSLCWLRRNVHRGGGGGGGEENTQSLEDKIRECGDNLWRRLDSRSRQKVRPWNGAQESRVVHRQQIC